MFSKHFIYPDEFQAGDIIHQDGYGDRVWIYMLTHQLGPNEHTGNMVWSFINLGHAKNGQGRSAFQPDERYHVTRPVYSDIVRRQRPVLVP